MRIRLFSLTPSSFMARVYKIYTSPSHSSDLKENSSYQLERISWGRVLATTGDSLNEIFPAQLIKLGPNRQKSYSHQGLRWDDSLKMSAGGFTTKFSERTNFRIVLYFT